MKQILSLDLGTDTGYAMGDLHLDIQPKNAGAWKLADRKSITEYGKTRMTRRCDPRVMHLYRTLRKLYADIVVFEDVQFASSTYQVQLWSSFRAAVWCAFGDRGGVVIECVPTGTLKKFATGHGGATKEMMAASLYRLRPEWEFAKLSDDAVDAIWLWLWAAKHLKNV